LGATHKANIKRFEHLQGDEWGSSLNPDNIHETYKPLAEEEKDIHKLTKQLPEIARFLNKCDVVIIQCLNQVSTCTISACMRSVYVLFLS
jgi:hypothetical protein